eukprot:274584_1
MTSYLDMIKGAITSLKDTKRGMSRSDISKYIQSNYDNIAKGAAFQTWLNKTLQHGINSRVLILGTNKLYKLRSISEKERKKTEQKKKKEIAADEERKRKKIGIYKQRNIHKYQTLQCVQCKQQFAISKVDYNVLKDKDSKYRICTGCMAW